MSSYVTFWFKDKKGNRIILGDYSRASVIYQIAYECGVDCIKGKKDENDFFCKRYAEPFTFDRSREMINALQEEKAANKKIIEENNKKIELIKDFKNTTVEERLAAVEDYMNSNKSCEENGVELEYAINFLTFIEEVRDINSWSLSKEDKDNLIWAGIDCYIKENKEDND